MRRQEASLSIEQSGKVRAGNQGNRFAASGACRLSLSRLPSIVVAAARSSRKASRYFQIGLEVRPLGRELVVSLEMEYHLDLGGSRAGDAPITV